MGRAPCCSKVGLHRGAWSLKEDKLLTQYIQTHGEGHWKSLPSKAGLLRCGKSCRLRWKNYLQPGIKRGNITTDEEDLIIRLHSLLGNRWSLIARRLPGRTDNDIKNHWNTHLRKRLVEDGAPIAPGNPKLKTKKKGERVISNEDVTESNKASESNSSDVSSSANGGVVLNGTSTEALNSPWPFIEEACDEDVLQDDVMMSGWDHSVKYWSVFTDDNKLEELYDEYLQLLNWEE